MKNHLLSLQTVSVKICFFFIFLLLPLFCFAQLGKYEFYGTTAIDKQNNQVTSQPPHATFSEFTRVGVSYSFGNNIFNTRGWTPGTLDYSIYIEFTITAHPNYTLNLSQIQFESSRSKEGATQVRVAHNASGNFTTDYLDFKPINENYQNIMWDFPDIKTSIGGSVTFRIYGLLPMHGTGTLRLDNVALYGTIIPQLSINEFHYANTTSTQTGFVEVIAPKDFTELSTATLTLYNSEGKMYDSYSLDKFKSLPNSIYGDLKIYYLDIPKGLVDGNGGLSLSMGDHLLQFLSYGGTITAIDGPALNASSEDIEVAETAADGAYHSLALMPDPNRSLDSDAAEPTANWTKADVDNNTKGYINTDPYMVLPVELVSFQAKVTDRGVRLNWATATEINNKNFVVERSISENLEFKAIGKITGHGTTLQQQQYTFLDSKPIAGTSYYRLKQTDLDNTITYSKVIAVTSKEIFTAMSLYPNPAEAFINVTLDTPASSEEMLVQVIDLKGRVMYQQLHKYVQKTKELTIPVADLPAGSYYLVVTKDGKREAKAFLKGR